MDPDSMDPDSMDPDSMDPDSMDPDSMDPDSKAASNEHFDINQKSHQAAGDLRRAGRLGLSLLTWVLLVLTDLAAGLLRCSLFRRHFDLMVSGVLLFGPALGPWVSRNSIFANRNHFLYRKFLDSCWGWTCISTSSFVFILSFSLRPSLALSLRHLSRVAVTGAMWWGCVWLLAWLEDAAGSCYQPLPQAGGLSVGPGAVEQPLSQPGGLSLGRGAVGQPLLLLPGVSKASCLRAGLLWHGWHLCEDTLLLCLCCLVLAEEGSAFRPHLALGKSWGNPLRLLFLLCVSLLALWLSLLVCLLAHLPQFPSQLLGGAVGCLMWRGLYRGWCCLGPGWWCLGRPGEGLFLTNTDGQTE